MIRRGVGFIENLKRFFGGGTFSDVELKDYLKRLNGENPTGQPGADTGKIEGDFDADNKARAVVAKKLHLDQPVRVRVLLIQEMLDGHVSEADEEAIIRILEDADLGDQFELIRAVGSERLQKELTGKEYNRFMKLLGTVNDTDPVPPVPLDWKVVSLVSGPKTDAGPLGVLLNSLSFRTLGGQNQSVISNKSVTKSPDEIVSDVPHPRDQAGEVTVDALPGVVEGDSVTPIAMGALPRTATYPAVTKEYDAVEVLLDLEYDKRPIGSDKTGKTTTKGTVTGEDNAHTEGSMEEKKTGTNTTTGQNKTKGTTTGASVDVEVGGSVTGKQSETKRKGTNKTKVDLKTTTDDKSKVNLKTKNKGTDKVDLTGTTTGTNITDGDITIDLKDVKFDADIATEIKGKADLKKGSPSTTRRLLDLTKGVRKWIVKKVVDRYLGPLAGGPAAEGAEWIIDKLVDKPPDWTVTVDLNNKGSINGKVTGGVTGKWHEVQKINETTKTKGTIKKNDSGSIKGDVKTKGKGTIKGDEITTVDETDTTTGTDATISGKVGVGSKVDKKDETTDIDQSTKIDETTTGTSVADTKTKIQRDERSTADFTGKDRFVNEFFVSRANLRVRLTGEGPRYHTLSDPGQRGGTAPPDQQKGPGL